MRWQIANFEFCDKQQTLTSEHGTQQLEPLMVELLSYFCQHQDQIISKQQLIDDVWLGRIVSDNAISKLITKLRKAFDDDVRQPKFIATFPKKGYKFIAQVQEINEQHIVSPASVEREFAPSSHQSQAERHPKVPMAASVVMLALLVLIIVTVFKFSEPTSPRLFTTAKTLTTDAGDELFPSFSPDGSRMSFMSIKTGRIQLQIRDLSTGQTVNVDHGETFGVGPADWSKDGTSLVYLVATEDVCEYYIRQITGLELGTPKLVHRCPAGSYGKILFTHDANKLVFAQNSGHNTAYTLYSLTIDNQAINRLNQPEIYIGGNSQFDLHPQENRLLISSPNRQQWEGFYDLNLESNELELLFYQDAYICCGIWSHDGDRVVLMGEHPSYELVSYALDGSDPVVIYAGSRIIRLPRRHINGQDYVFASQESDTNFYTIDLSTNTHQSLTDNSVDELLTRFAHNAPHIAYISFESGSEEVWLDSTDGNNARQLSAFSDNKHYVDLVWSPDDQSIAVLTLNEIRLISVATGDYRLLKIPQTEIRGMSFKSDSKLSYSIREGNRWRVFTYDLDNDRIIPEENRWQFIQYQDNSANSLWLDNDNQLFVGDSKIQAEIPEGVISQFINGRQFNLRKVANQWYWYDYQQARALKSFSDDTQSYQTILETDVPHFDVNESRLLYGKRDDATSNLYRTVPHTN